MEKMVSEFKKAHPDKTYDITFGVVGEIDVKTKFLEDPDAAADVFSFPNDQMNELIKAGALYQITRNTEKIESENSKGSVAVSYTHLDVYKRQVKGRWVKGPGKKLTDVLDEAAGSSRILAEDLGVLHPTVKRLLERCGYPGMKVLLFAFDNGADNDHLPHRYQQNQAVYGGTHDNETIAGYCARCTDAELRFLMDYLRCV